MDEVKLPTKAQIKYANELLEKLGYDKDDYDFEKMTRSQMSKLIGQLKREWEG